MNRLILIGCLLIAATTGLSSDQTQTPIKGTSVGMIAPAGFVPAERFPGFLSEETASSIMVTELPTPVLETMSGFTKEGLAGKGMNLLGEERFSFGEFEGRLLSVSQKAQAIVFRKWIGVFGDTQRTILVTAAFPSTSPTNLSFDLKKAVMSARMLTNKANPADALIFDLNPAGTLKVAKIIGNTLALSQDGKFPVNKLEAPVMLVGASASKDLQIATRIEFAVERLKKTATLERITTEPPIEITINGLGGFEIIAQAQDSASGRTAMIYQVMLFEETDYFLMQGIAAEEDKATVLPMFKETAASFRRK
jgi:hypothetical protein